MIQEAHSVVVPQRTVSRKSNRHLYTHAHTSAIHNSQKVEQTKYLSMDKQINKMSICKQWIIIQL